MHAACKNKPDWNDMHVTPAAVECLLDKLQYYCNLDVHAGKCVPSYGCWQQPTRGGTGCKCDLSG